MLLYVSLGAHPVDLDECAALVVQPAARWHDGVPELGCQVVCVVVRLVEVTRHGAERQLHAAAAAAVAAAEVKVLALRPRYGFS
jgi:hypothetical protein